MPRGRVEAVDPIAVQQSRTRIREIHVPDAIGVFGEPDAMRFFARVLRLEHAQFHHRGVF
jgi:hypothetical protein